MRGKPPRPVGITLIAALALLVGISGFFASLAIFSIPALTRSVGVGLGLLVLFSSLMWLLLSWSYFKGKGWAWILGLILCIFSIISAVGAIAPGQAGAVVGLLIWGFMLYYLTRPRVKAFFKKGGLQAVPSYPGTGQGIQGMGADTFGQSTSGASGPTFAPLLHPSSVPFSEAESQPTSSADSSKGSSVMTMCPNCGSRVDTARVKCPSCGASL